MLFVGFFWLLMTCVADLQILAHMWGAVWSVVCSMWTLNCVARNSFYSRLLPTLPLPSSALRYTAYLSASRWCKPGYLQVFTEPMGKAAVLAIPNSGCFWCSFPLSCQHLYLLYSPVGGRHQTLCSQIPLNYSASMSNTPENNYTVFFSREVRIPAT